MRGPDFFIVGAPKCGTTAMADYLGQHPQIGMCDRKESHFFADEELHARLNMHDRPRKSLEEYLSWFGPLQGFERLGEASVWYLSSVATARRMKEFAPQARAIAMIRNPITAIPALHSEFVHMGIEPEVDLERAFALDPERERNGFPPGFPPASYRRAYQFASWIDGYRGVFGAERVHVIVFDEFKANTADVYRDVCSFLDVDPAFVPDLRVVNANKRPRVRALQRLVKRPPAWLRRLARAVSSEPMRRVGASKLSRMNTVHEPRGAVPASVVAGLAPEVGKQVEELRSLLGLDLDAWLREADAALGVAQGRSG